MQYGALTDKWYQTYTNVTTPRETLQKIRGMWSNDDPDDDAVTAFWDPAGTGAQAVLPYRHVRESQNPGRFRIYVY